MKKQFIILCIVLFFVEISSSTQSKNISEKKEVTPLRLPKEVYCDELDVSNQKIRDFLKESLKLSNEIGNLINYSADQPNQTIIEAGYYNKFRSSMREVRDHLQYTIDFLFIYSHLSRDQHDIRRLIKDKIISVIISKYRESTNLYC